ncbi:RNase adapter RapZ [Sandaracinus amylolyticus]|uniref:RNase adapter RapZ n=1 Tax=Sandaracinus amylolyticus TaxID=927083 RepID=UPI00069EB230|nr:RNase adapter RapZ [Sandaracinus amylolyticus]
MPYALPPTVGTPLHIVVVTGMSGAGRTSALHVLEDVGFFCVDNLPPKLAPGLVELLAAEGQLTRVGLGVDVRTRGFLVGAGDLLDRLSAGGHEVEVLFLDCADDVLVRRYSESRRPHPLAQGGDVIEAIARERERLASLRVRARRVIDTSRLSVHELRRTLVEAIGRSGARPTMQVRIVSFGFKYGLPVDADLVFDLRFLPNPHHVPELKPLTGRDPPVAEYVLRAPETQSLLVDLKRVLTDWLPRYEAEGKAYLTIAVGCTGGRHRSVAIAEELARTLRAGTEGEAREVTVAHRDVSR